MTHVAPSTFANSVGLNLLRQLFDHNGLDVASLEAPRPGRTFGARAAAVIEELSDADRDKILAQFSRCEDLADPLAENALIEACAGDNMLRFEIESLKHDRQRALAVWLAGEERFVAAEHRFYDLRYRDGRYHSRFHVRGVATAGAQALDLIDLENELRATHPERRDIEMRRYPLHDGKTLFAIDSAAPARHLRYFAGRKTRERAFRAAVAATVEHCPSTNTFEIAGKFWRKFGRKNIAKILTRRLYGAEADLFRVRAAKFDLSSAVDRRVYDFSPELRVRSARLVRLRFCNPFKPSVTEEMMTPVDDDIWNVLVRSRRDGIMDWLANGGLWMIEFAIEMEPTERHRRGQRIRAVFHADGRTNLRSADPAQKLILEELAPRWGIQRRFEEELVQDAQDAA